MWRPQKACEVGLRGRSFKTQSDIDRHIEKGFGQGTQELYVPWLRVQGVPSHGRSRKVHGVKVDRLHHLLSDLEYGYLLVAEFSPDVLDIREQFPILPQSSAVQSIAHALNIRYPLLSRHQGAFCDDDGFSAHHQAARWKHALSGAHAQERLLMKSTLPRIEVGWPSSNHDHELKVG